MLSKTQFQNQTTAQIKAAIAPQLKAGQVLNYASRNSRGDFAGGNCYTITAVDSECVSYDGGGTCDCKLPLQSLAYYIFENQARVF